MLDKPLWSEFFVFFFHTNDLRNFNKERSRKSIYYGDYYVPPRLWGTFRCNMDRMRDVHSASTRLRRRRLTYMYCTCVTATFKLSENYRLTFVALLVVRKGIVFSAHNLACLMRLVIWNVNFSVSNSRMSIVY